MKIESGEIVIVVLHSPREKVWGILQEISGAGIYIRGIDLNAFNEFVRSAQNGEHLYGFSHIFFPMWRIERLTRDEQDGDIPSLLQQFEARTGLRIEEV
jgi:hypothetical protein